MMHDTRSEQPISVAILGATRGAKLAAKFWIPTGYFTPVALCDLDARRARERLALFGDAADDVALFDDSDKLFDWGEFDVLLVATPDETHAALACRAFELGHDCFIEKPMTTDVSSAAALVAAWRRSGRIGVAGHEYRYAEVMRAAKSYVEQGRIGRPILAVTTDSCGRMGSYWRRRRWRTSQRPASKTLTLQKAIHQLDIQTFLLGSRPIRAFASAGQDRFGGTYPSEHRCEVCEDSHTCLYAAQKVPNQSTVQDGLCVFSDDVDLHDNQTVVIDYENGARGTYVECFFTPDYKFEHTIVGDEGQLVIRCKVGAPEHELELTWIGSSDRDVQAFNAKGGHGGGDNALAAAFGEALRTRTQIQPDPIDGYAAVALAAAIDRSAETGQPQSIAAPPGRSQCRPEEA